MTDRATAQPIPVRPSRSARIEIAACGALAGSLLLAAIGFGVGGWQTAAEVRDLMADRAETGLAAALVPVCVERARNDPNRDDRLAAIRAATTGERDIVVAAGWVAIPGNTAAHRQAAAACLEALGIVLW